MARAVLPGGNGEGMNKPSEITNNDISGGCFYINEQGQIVHCLLKGKDGHIIYIKGAS